MERRQGNESALFVDHREENSHVKEIVVIAVVGERGLFSNTEAVKKQPWKWLGRKLFSFLLSSSGEIILFVTFLFING